MTSLMSSSNTFYELLGLLKDAPLTTFNPNELEKFAEEHGQWDPAER